MLLDVNVHWIKTNNNTRLQIHNYDDTLNIQSSFDGKHLICKS